MKLIPVFDLNFIMVTLNLIGFWSKLTLPCLYLRYSLVHILHINRLVQILCFDFELVIVNRQRYILLELSWDDPSDQIISVYFLIDILRKVHKYLCLRNLNIIQSDGWRCQDKYTEPCILCYFITYDRCRFNEIQKICCSVIYVCFR